MIEIKQKEFIRLYEENVNGVYRYVFLRVNSIEVAQDITSEVFLRSWEKLNDTNENTEIIIKNPRAFFYKIARNLVVDFYRQKSKADISLEELPLQVLDHRNNPGEKMNLALEFKSIQRALNQLKDDYRDVIIWHYVDDLSIPEIADILGKTENATRVMLSRGLQQLRKHLKAA